jgi:peptidoglycan/LPS O-acetylase OafA/YrhL
MDLFFLLSGFLITGILLDSREKPGYFRNFYARRFLRIIPLYFTVILVMWAIYRRNGRYFTLCLLFLANFQRAFHVLGPTGAGVFWSLAVEEYFYLVWPWTVRLLKRKALTLTACAIILVTPMLRLWAFHAGWSPRAEIYSYSWRWEPYLRFGRVPAGRIVAHLCNWPVAWLP